MKTASEETSRYVNAMEFRSCYPSGKRVAKTLCAVYEKQYNTDVVLARPCHIYASADSSSDSRAAGQFITKFLMRWSDVMSVYITSEKISYFIYMLNKRNKNANTIAAYSRNIKKLVLFLDGSGLSKEQMYAYREWLKKSGFKKRTVNAYLSTANYFCEIMGCPEMKIELEHLPYEEFQNTMQISASNYKKIIYMALQDNNERLAMMIQVLCHTDLRFCELQFLTVEALEKGYIEVIRKHEKIKLFIPDIVLKDLKKYIKHRKIISGMVFCTRNGSMVNRSNFRKELKKICILAGVDETKVSIQNVKNVVLDSYPHL